jgi:hypothetical protein
MTRAEKAERVALRNQVAILNGRATELHAALWCLAMAQGGTITVDLSAMPLYRSGGMLSPIETKDGGKTCVIQAGVMTADESRLDIPAVAS